MIVLTGYVTIVIVGLLQVGRVRLKIIDSLIFIANSLGILGLIFISIILSDGKYLVPRWIPLTCLFLSLLFFTGMIRLLSREILLRRHAPTPEERTAAWRELKKRYPATIATLVIGVSWIIVIGRESFGEVRSHLLSMIIGVVVSAIVGWIFVLLVNVWMRRNRTAL